MCWCRYWNNWENSLSTRNLLVSTLLTWYYTSIVIAWPALFYKFEKCPSKKTVKSKRGNNNSKIRRRFLFVCSSCTVLFIIQDYPKILRNEDKQLSWNLLLLHPTSEKNIESTSNFTQDFEFYKACHILWKPLQKSKDFLHLNISCVWRRLFICCYKLSLTTGQY